MVLPVPVPSFSHNSHETSTGTLGVDFEQTVHPPFLAPVYQTGDNGTLAGHFEQTVDPSFLGPVYRTGDYGRWLEDGCLELLGRKDDQIKHRGRRIELGEIQAAMERCPLVRTAAVRLYRYPPLEAGAARPNEEVKDPQPIILAPYH
jgi:acyl-CoA synthetase (AMP-forming)/AMP-acid ligase II